MELSYSVRPGHTFLVGYNRSYTDVYFTNFVGYHAATARYTGKFFGRVRTSLAGTYRNEAGCLPDRERVESRRPGRREASSGE